MTDNLPTVDSDNGPVEANPVVIMNSDGTPVQGPSVYNAANGKSIEISTTTESLLSDDFGSSVSVDATIWDTLDGGLGLNPNLGNGQLAQAAIGTGITGITESLAASSALTVNMGTVANAERWYLSKQVFCGKEDILIIARKSQPIVANHIFFGMVEVDRATGVPLLNPNLAAEFTNSGGLQLGLTVTPTAFQARAVGDSSNGIAVGAVGVGGNTVSNQEFLIEIDSRDVIVQTGTQDSVIAKAAGASRVSTQVPNDKKLYKMVMRFKNIGAPATNTAVIIERILIVDNYEQRVQISSGEGDVIAAKALPVNVANIPGVTVSSGAINATLVGTALAANTNSLIDHKLIAAAGTNGTTVKAGAGKIMQGMVFNASAAVKFFKLYNKATVPTVGTDVPIATYPIPAGGTLYLADLFGIYGKWFSVGVSYALTGAAADSDATALVAGDAIVNLGYV